MTLAADRLWSAEQQGWLLALGHAVYLPADWPTEAGAPAPAAAPPPAAVVAEPASRPSPARGRIPARDAIDSAPPARPAPVAPRATAARPTDRLYFALIRASGCNPSAPGAAELFAQWPSSAELRGNPAAKRALWPTLRRLRRGTPA
ncbi:alanine acetyltransferase [Pseudoxanthomonas mexicana]